MKAKRLAIFSCIIGACLITTVAPSVSCRGSDVAQIDNSVSESRYNLDPNVSGKRVASNYAMWDRVVPATLAGAMGASTCVIIGEVGDSIVTSTELTSASGFTNTMQHTIASVKVLETITGKPPSSDVINYRQVGEGDYSWQTKVKKGEICVFILVYLEEIDQYMATAQEESIWYVDGKNKLTSMSDQIFAAKYDGIDLSVLIEDILEFQTIEINLVSLGYIDEFE